MSLILVSIVSLVTTIDTAIVKKDDVVIIVIL